MKNLRKILLADGVFRLTGDPERAVLEHKCTAAYEGEKYRWKAHMYSWENRAVPCSWCGVAASEGLQATFWFLKTEGPDVI
jgi:hypothetical protein